MKENLELAQKMLNFADLKEYGIESKNNRVFFVTHKGEPKYELWEVSTIWSVSAIDKTLLKKHEDFYFAFKHLLLILIDQKLDQTFDKVEEGIL